MAASSLQSGVSIKARMMSFQESLSSTSDSDVCSEDCWSTTKLSDSLPLSIISLLSNTSSNAADNLTSVSLSFTEVLLPPLRTLVSQSMEDYLQQHSWDTLKVDPIKKNLLNRPKIGNASVSNRHELAFLFLENHDQRCIKTLNLDDCGDIRVFLKIMAKAGCFPDDETELVKKLKDLRNQLAHQDIFPREFLKTVFDDMLSLLEAIESNHKHDTSNHQRKLKQLRKFGAQQYLKRNKKGDQLSSLKSSIMSSSTEEMVFIESLIDATIIDITQEEEENDRSATETANGWATMNIEKPTLFCKQFIFKSNRNRDANLESILRSSKQRVSKVSLIGMNFKMLKRKFAQGSSRIAYRGHFEGDQITPWFEENPEVVLKKSYRKMQNTTENLMKIRYFSSVLVEEFGNLPKVMIVGLKIKLLDLLVLVDEDMTMEPYIDHTSYTKW